ncbi:MAG: IS4 family transposase [Chitinophagaceae bacterium]
MSKSNYFFGQTVLGQVLRLIPQTVVNRVVKKTGSDFAIKKFNTQNHLYTMCYAVIGDITGLRHISDGLVAMGNSLSQIGISYVPPKSTLSDSNKNRPSEVFAQIYQGLYEYYYPFLSDRAVPEPLLAKAYAVDSTSMPLFKAILKASGRKSKDGSSVGGIKSHIQISLIDELPMNIKHTSGATNDHTFLKDLELNAHDIAIFDKAYVDYRQYALWGSKDIYFVTREKDNAKSTTILERDLPDDKDFEILIDEEVMKVYKDENGQKQQLLLRRTVVWSEKHQDTIVLLSNTFHLEAFEISMLYRKRWRIELLFKQLKQNFPLKYFVGDNQNAIETQIWCVLIVNLLLTIIRLKVKNKNTSFALLVSIIRQHAMSYLNIVKYLQSPEGLRKQYQNSIKRNKNEKQAVLVFNTS